MTLAVICTSDAAPATANTSSAGYPYSPVAKRETTASEAHAPVHQGQMMSEWRVCPHPEELSAKYSRRNAVILS